jgi:hypothetical protein
MFEFAKEKDAIQQATAQLYNALDAAAEELRRERESLIERSYTLGQGVEKLRVENYQHQQNMLAFESEKIDLRAAIAIYHEETESLKREVESLKAQARGNAH